MVNVEPVQIRKMFDYLSAPVDAQARADGAFVFGRADPLVARAAASHIDQVGYALIVGGIGKDSGALTRLQIPEAHYLASLMIRDGVSGDKLYIEPRPTNGGQCWEMGIESIVNNNLPHETLKVLIHPTSLRRIMAQAGAIFPRVGFEARLQGAGTDYAFNAENPVDQKEAVAEMLRLADWPGKGWSTQQSDLPQELVQVARNYDADWKAQQR